MKVPVFCVDANSVDKYSSKVFKMYEVEYYLYVHIPHDFCLEYKLFQIDEVSPQARKCDLISYIYQECGKPWIRIPTSFIDLSIGLHVYRLSLSINIQMILYLFILDIYFKMMILISHIST